jgi:hypothetical protein
VLFAQALVEAKTIVGRTAFPGWLRKHARNTALHAAADRWMPLASFKSTRSAYRRIGVVDEDDG